MHRSSTTKIRAKERLRVTVVIVRERGSMIESSRTYPEELPLPRNRSAIFGCDIKRLQKYEFNRDKTI